jgi:hypothetical protein
MPAGDQWVAMPPGVNLNADHPYQVAQFQAAPPKFASGSEY